MTSAVPARNGGPGRRSPRTSHATPPDTRMETAVAKPCKEDGLMDPELPFAVPGSGCGSGLSKKLKPVGKQRGYYV